MNDHPRDVLNSLLTNGSLDKLLDEARKQASPAPGPSTKAQLDAALDDVTKQAEAVRDGLVLAITKREELRAEKVAYVRRMLHIGTRLISA